MEILKSHGTLFLAPIRWSTFTLKYLRINNNEEGLLRIRKLKTVSEYQDRHRWNVWILVD